MLFRSSSPVSIPFPVIITPDSREAVHPDYVTDVVLAPVVIPTVDTSNVPLPLIPPVDQNALLSPHVSSTVLSPAAVSSIIPLPRKTSQMIKTPASTIPETVGATSFVPIATTSSKTKTQTLVYPSTGLEMPVILEESQSSFPQPSTTVQSASSSLPHKSETVSTANTDTSSTISSPIGDTSRTYVTPIPVSIVIPSNQSSTTTNPVKIPVKIPAKVLDPVLRSTKDSNSRMNETQKFSDQGKENNKCCTCM